MKTIKTIKKSTSSRSIKPTSPVNLPVKFDEVDKIMIDMVIKMLLNRLPPEIRKYDLQTSLGNLYYKTECGRIMFIYKKFPTMVITPKMVEYVRLINHIKSVVNHETD